MALFVVPANAQAAEWHIQDNATGGDCSLIGTWDTQTKTCTLSQNLSQGIIMEGVNIILDGNGRTITGNNTGNGVYLNGNTGITIKNLNVQNFLNGILLSEAFNNTLTSNTTSNNNTGISITDGSSNNVLTGNTASNNSDSGIFLYSSINNALTGNTANSNHIGIYLYSSATNYNTLTDNTAEE